MFKLTRNTHLLVYPSPAYSHIIPFLELTRLLLCRGLIITLIVSGTNFPQIDHLLSAYPSSLHKLHFPEPEIITSPYPLIAKVNSTMKLFDPIVQWFKSHPWPPVAIISDFFLGWTSEFASHLGIRRVMFSTAGALGSSVFHTLWRDIVEINAENSSRDENFLISLPEIPNSPKFPWWQLPPVSRNYKKGEQDFESFRKGIMKNLTSWGIVYNTFEKLEGVYIDHMKKLIGHDRVWAIGPLLTTMGSSSAVIPDDLLMWLDKKRDDSVVYICFGSQDSLNEKQTSALTCALEISKVDFILCVKETNSIYIPNGFEHEVGARGFIVRGWAPQCAILNHRSVGSFLTHCGWNSLLEAVAASVMMLTWPMGADHFANATLVVDQLGVGKRVCEGGTKSVPDSIELARLLDESLTGEQPELVKVKELSQVAINTVKDGTSKWDLDEFIKLLYEL